jgi:hypothetical protein
LAILVGSTWRIQTLSILRLLFQAAAAAARTVVITMVTFRFGGQKIDLDKRYGAVSGGT